MKQLIKRTQIIWLFILAISFVGCNEDDDVNLPEVVASFAKTINADTGTVSFLNLSENADSYTWDFGDGTSSTEINPIKSFATGTYTVALTAENGAGASSTFEDELVVDIPLPVGLPITFDDPNVNYDVTTFGGVTFEIVDNPDASGSNTSNSKVGAITNGGAAFEGFYFDLGRPIDLATLKSIKVNFWSDTPIDVLLKLEEGTAGAVEATASHGGSGWEETFFNFDSDASYSRFTLFVDPSGTTAGTFYIDDIEQAETPAASSGCIGTPIPAVALPLDFEGCETFPSSDNFGAGITSELGQNPSKSGINTSDFVLKVDKPTGSDFFAGIQNTFASNFDLTTTNIFKVKVYSTKANAVIRFELALNPQSNPVTGNPAPVYVTVPNANEWTEVEVIFTGLPGAPTAYNQLVIKPDNDQTDSPITAGGTYYFDDLTLSSDSGSGGPGQGEIAVPCVGSLLQDYEAADNSIFSDFGGGTAVIIDNPNTTVNTSVKVGQMQKFAGEPFGGTTMSLDTPEDFANGEVFTMDVFSQKASALTFKLEGLNIEKVITTAGTGWETMTFDFTGETGAAAVPAITLIFDNGTPGDAAGDPDAWTFLFDNLRLCDSGGGGTTCPAPPAGDLVSNGDFEAGEGCWQLIQNGGTVTLSTTESNGGGTNSAQIQTAPGVNPAIKQERFGVGIYLPNTEYRVTFDIKASTPLTTGAVFKAFTFSEGADGSATPATQHILEGGLATVSNSWETKTYTFTSAANADQVAGGISFLAELVCGPAGCDGLINIEMFL